MTMEWREQEGVRWLEADLGGARAAFGTRLGGVSEPPFDSLNLGVVTDDEPANVRENRLRLATALGHDPGRITFARQVHGAELLTHRGPPSCAFWSPEDPNSQVKAGPPEADGHVISEAGLAALVFTADCLPVAVSGPGGVAMLHCGWRGLAAGIVASGAAAVEATDAAIGPGIGPCCYEVGPEVLDAFRHLGESAAPPADGPISCSRINLSAHRRLDLVEMARRLLAAAGVRRVQSADLCTRCHPELFFSHRRDEGRTGRQGNLAWIEPVEA
ncbi:MAG TPA: polyphenol oxidase family protein [Solirubrobacterales bacterium]|nr:polyphenol oxidase family protein [Solirubrobacterales bacterium]